ncbi:MAG: phosphopantetheine-binding protein [Kiritimatiellia bacterium]
MNEQVIEILRGIRPEFEFEGVENFFEEGMLDSFDLVTLVAELDKTFSIHIDGMAIVPENFANINEIVALVERSK